MDNQAKPVIDDATIELLLSSLFDAWKQLPNQRDREAVLGTLEAARAACQEPPANSSATGYAQLLDAWLPQAKAGRVLWEIENQLRVQWGYRLRPSP